MTRIKFRRRSEEPHVETIHDTVSEDKTDKTFEKIRDFMRLLLGSLYYLLKELFDR